MADNNEKKYIKYENTTYELVDGKAREQISDIKKELKIHNSLNLFPSSNKTSTNNGITFTPIDDGYVLTGATSEEPAIYKIYDNPTSLPDGFSSGETVTITFNKSDTQDTRIFLQFWSYTSNGLQSDAPLYSIRDAGQIKITIPIECIGMLIRIRVVKNTTFSDAIKVYINMMSASSNLELKNEIESIKSTPYPYSSNPKYIAYGDSLTQGAIWDRDINTSYYIASKQNQIPTRIANAIMTTDFQNHGVSGARFVKKGDSDTSTIIGDVIKADDLSDVKIITIGGGRNDSATALGNGATATVDDGTICGAFVGIFEYLRENYPKLQIVVYGVTPQPTKNNHAPENIFTCVFSGGWSLLTYYEEVGKVCARYGVPFIGWTECTLMYNWGILSGGYSRNYVDDNGNPKPNWSHPAEEDTLTQMGNYIGGRVAAYYTG